MLNSKLRQGVTPYLLATAVVLLMAVARWALGVVVGEQLPFITFIIAVLVVAWFGGLGPAAFATLLSAIFAVLLFIPPVGSLHLADTMGAIRLLLFGVTGLTAGFLGESRLRAQARASRCQQRRPRR